MDDLYSTPRPRVTSDMLSKYIGTPVTLMGIVQPGSISPNGDKLRIATKSNNQGVVEIHLSTALNELLEDIIEVTGKVSSPNSLECMSYKALNQSETPFDFDTFNAALEIMNNYPTLN